MKMTLFCILTFATVFVFVSTASASVHAKPGTKKSSVVLEGERVYKHRPPYQAPTNHTPSPPPPVQCGSVDDEFTICVSDTGIDLIDDPEALPAQVLQAVREIGLPGLDVHIQPGTSTLVNAETIFYARPQRFRRSIDLLGFDIDVQAEPISYHWIHGDGTASTTDVPGRPYPAMDVTHRYRKPADSVHPRVDVTYRVRYRVDDGSWQTIAQTLAASGPATDLEIKEAAPVLIAP